MIWMALGLAAIGLFFSALFSGSETGFYRATRMRLVLDALGGDPVSRVLHWLTNQPTLFIATTLVGNNLANYVVSLAIVMGAQTLWSGHGHIADLLAPLALAPVLFVYGELLPKRLFLHAPNRLLRMSGPLLLICVVLFLPVSALLWGLNRLLARFATESPEMIRLKLARRELQRVLEEGHEAGILHPAQRSMAQGIFALAGRPIGTYSVPLEEVAKATSDMSKAEILELARRHHLAAVPLEQPGREHRLIGYVRVIDLRLDPSSEITPVRPLLAVAHSDTYISVLTRLHGAKENLAEVLDEAGRAVGIVTVQSLREPLFGGGKP
ncbi:MAG: DUF21 domain-containing protein [Pirellulales bacterium]|nr:DUF21 domain-containing protein [Pirellulales bacterium]